MLECLQVCLRVHTCVGVYVCVCCTVLWNLRSKQTQHRVRIVVMVHALHPSIPLWLLLRGLVAPPSGNRRNFRDFDKSIDELWLVTYCLRRHEDRSRVGHSSRAAPVYLHRCCTHCVTSSLDVRRVPPPHSFHRAYILACHIFCVDNRKSNTLSSHSKTFMWLFVCTRPPFSQTSQGHVIECDFVEAKFHQRVTRSLLHHSDIFTEFWDFILGITMYTCKLWNDIIICEIRNSLNLNLHFL